MLNIRKAQYKDLDTIDKIFYFAKKYMRENGNLQQWAKQYPNHDDVIKDMEKDAAYVVESDNRVVAYFAYIEGIEPTYINIEGKWLNDSEYGTIHRIATDGSIKGIFEYVIAYLVKKGKDIRIDTHADNKTMLHLVEKCGFEYCGIIYVADGTPRLAFHKKV